MPTSWRPFLIAAALLCFSAPAAAQTVMVTQAPAGGKIDLVVGGKPAGSGTADSSGVATIPFNLQSAAGVAQMDARVYVDVCSQLHRIQITERNQLPPTREEGCDRREISGVFWVRPANTLVIKVGGAIPTLLLVRGGYDPDNPAPLVRAADGLVIFGGGGLIGFDEIAGAACGTVTDCRQDGAGAVYAGGVAYWILPWLAAEGTYMRPSRLTTAGGGTGFDFTSTFDVHLFTALANVAAPVGRARIYGKVGGVFHRASQITRQVIGEESQTIELKTEGWGPVYGGGFEAWIKPRFGIYAEGAFGTLKGQPVIERVEGDLDEGFKHLLMGVRVKLF